MTVGIVGLGLIGGSFARAYKEHGERVLAWNRTQSILDIAEMSDVVDAPLTAENMKDCDLILITLYPEATIHWLEDNADDIAPDTLVMDACGTKRKICAHCFSIAKEHGFTFVGGHPMAGTQFSGFKHSRGSLFKGCSIIIVPESFDDILLFDRVKQLLSPTQFGRLTVTSAENHDRMIAFTSQMAHVVSSAYIKSPTALEHKGFSAGSYRDLTRVAWLNETMWTELFLENRDNLIGELNSLISALEDYRNALDTQDEEALCRLLYEGKQIKEQLDRASLKN